MSLKTNETRISPSTTSVRRGETGKFANAAGSPPQEQSAQIPPSKLVGEEATGKGSDDGPPSAVCAPTGTPPSVAASSVARLRWGVVVRRPSTVGRGASALNLVSTVRSAAELDEVKSGRWIVRRVGDDELDAVVGRVNPHLLHRRADREGRDGTAATGREGEFGVNPGAHVRVWAL